MHQTKSRMVWLEVTWHILAVWIARIGLLAIVMYLAATKPWRIALTERRCPMFNDNSPFPLPDIPVRNVVLGCWVYKRKFRHSSSVLIRCIRNPDRHSNVKHMHHMIELQLAYVKGTTQLIPLLLCSSQCNGLSLLHCCQMTGRQ